MTSGLELRDVIGDGVVPVVRTTRTDLAVRAIGWLREAGFTVFEVTLTVPDALDVIRALRRDAGLVVGAGTVLTHADAEACLAAGAQFLVSPVCAETLVSACVEAHALAIVSGLTPTEVHRAWSAGAHAVKVFPAGSVGGAAHVRALRSVFPATPLVPTGGVLLETLDTYFEAGADAVGIGGDLVNDTRILEADAETWIDRARAYRTRGRELRVANALRSATRVAASSDA